MLSKTLLMSSGVRIGSRTWRAETSASSASAVLRVSRIARSSWYAGSNLNVSLVASHVAKPSFSQMSSQYTGVTRSPNHWWAISWAAVEIHSC